MALNDLYTGCEKKLKITRKLAHGGSSEKILTVPIKAGWKAGTKIKFAGEGDETPYGAQDIEFILEEKPHPIYTRDGNDLKTSIKVDLADALCGFTRSLEFLDGTMIPITGGANGRPCQPGSVLFVKGKGMPISKQPGARGDLYVTVNVNFPPQLTDAQRADIKRIFA